MIDLTHKELVVLSDCLGRLETAVQTNDLDLLNRAAGFARNPKFATALRKIEEAQIATPYSED
jgi:hypothetical protein